MLWSRTCLRAEPGGEHVQPQRGMGPQAWAAEMHPRPPCLALVSCEAVSIWPSQRDPVAADSGLSGAMSGEDSSPGTW